MKIKDSLDISASQENNLSFEITHLVYNQQVSSVTVGVFPTHGRYFRKEMTTSDGMFFTTAVEIPEGKSFYHLFYNRNFDQPVDKLPEILSEQDPLKRIVINQSTDVFCPLRFVADASCFGFISEEVFEVKVISMHTFIEEVSFYNQRHETIPMEMVYQHKNCKYWILRLNPDQLTAHFVLKVKGAQEISFYHKDNNFDEFPLFTNGFEIDFDKKIENRLIGPSSIGYQILPDRFKKSNDTTDKAGYISWDATPGHYDHLGGDLQGITDKLEYLNELGIDFIYLNPVFPSEYAHAYDVKEYKKVNSSFGDENSFKNLVSKAHELGIRIILDIPLNHCSRSFFAFQDVLENQENSAYKDWFEIYSFPVSIEGNATYDCWSGYKEYPCFNFNNQEVRKFFMGVAEFMVKEFDIDGWRLDSSTDIVYDFIEEFAHQTRLLKPDAFIVGENWHNDFSIANYGVDGITNYGLYWNILVPNLTGKRIRTGLFAKDLMDHFHQQETASQKYSWNFISNHDIPRFLSLVNEPNYYLHALTIMFAVPGTPVIYYGEEINMEGGQDPLNRKGMEWEKVQSELPDTYKWIKKLISVRKAYKEVFELGFFSIPYISDNNQVMVLKRKFANNSLFFVFNFSADKQVIKKVDLSGSETFTVIDGQNLNHDQLEIESYGCEIFKESLG